MAAWGDAVRAFEELGHPFEEARSRARLAAVLAASGDTGGARAAAEAARTVAAPPGGRARGERAGGGDRARSAGRDDARPARWVVRS